MKEYLKKDIIAAFAGWLSRFEWMYYATLTFSRNLSDPIAAFSHLKRLLQVMQAERAWMVAEWFKTWRQIHLHTLIAIQDSGVWKDYHNWWKKKYGVNWWRCYEKDKGVQYYLGKYLIKDIAEWDFWISEKYVIIT